MPELISEQPTKIQIPKRGQESVWSYPRPPRLERVSQQIRVEFGGLVLAETTQGYRLLETASPPVYYFPPMDVRLAYLMLSVKETVCRWRGIARYWSLRVQKRVALDAAWCYPHPREGYEVISDYFAFYPGKVDACYVGKQKVKPQPGDFYGGWITSHILGPFKGEAGTEFW
ncbi:MAG: DUF427 domain-containing protein [Nitrospirota bacterium]|nr:DUF427 domain-containing protein [Nitrospirota bacterium]MDH5775117.1 DUF427 domain-containing protein [Nitrospirota bacterium]